MKLREFSLNFIKASCVLFVICGTNAWAGVDKGYNLQLSVGVPSKLDVVDLTIESEKSSGIIFYRAWLKPQNIEIDLVQRSSRKWVGKIGPFKNHGSNQIEIEKHQIIDGKITTAKFTENIEVSPEISFVTYPRITNVDFLEKRQEFVIHGLNFSRQSKVKINGVEVNKYRADGPNRIRVFDKIKKSSIYNFEVTDRNTGLVAKRDGVVLLQHDSLPVAVVEFPINRHPMTEYITLDASKSYGGDQQLRYHWHILTKPQGSQINDGHLNQNYNANQTTFLPDKPGFYLIALIVASGASNSYSAYAAINVFRPADLQITTGELDFQARVGTSVVKNVNLKNISDTDPLVIDCIHLNGDEVEEFSGIPSLPLVIDPGKKVVLPLTYTPKQDTVTEPDPTTLGYSLHFQCGGDPADEKIVNFEATSYSQNPLEIYQAMTSSATDDQISVFDQQHFSLFAIYDTSALINIRLINTSQNDLEIGNLPSLVRNTEETQLLNIELYNIPDPIVVPASGSLDLLVNASPLNYPEANQGLDSVQFIWDPDLLPIDPDVEFTIFGRKLNSFGVLNPNPSVALNFDDSGPQVVSTQLLMSLDENGIPTNEYGPGLVIPSWQYVNHIDTMKFVGQGSEDFEFSNYIMPNNDESYLGRFEPTYTEGSYFTVGADLEGGFVPLNTGNRYLHFNIHFNPTQPASYYDVKIELEIRGLSQRFHVPIAVSSASPQPAKKR